MFPTQCQELLSYSVSRWNDTASNRWVSLCTAMRDYEAKQPRSVIDLPSGSVPQDRHLSSRAISCQFSVTELPSQPDVDHRLRVFGRGSVTRTDGLIQHQVFEAIAPLEDIFRKRGIYSQVSNAADA